MLPALAGSSMVTMRGGLVFFRGDGNAARAYLESDHSHADEYYLEHGAAVAAWSARDASGAVTSAAQLEGEQYQSWVDWVDPLTGEKRGSPRMASRIAKDGSMKTAAASPRFVEMTVNADKTLSVAAALSPEVSAAFDEAQAAAVEAMQAYMAEQSVTRVGPLGAQRLVPVERLESVAVVHRSSRAGDPHRHVHVQWSTRVFAAGKWRGMHTAATIKQQAALRGVGEAAINNHAGLRAALAGAGFTFNAAKGEVDELTSHARLLSKRSVQIERNLVQLERDWRELHPEQEPDKELRRRWEWEAWAKDRPQKRRIQEHPEQKWRDELQAAGLQVEGFERVQAQPLASLFEIDREQLAEDAVRAAEVRGSAWSVADLEGFVGVAVAKENVQATPAEVRTYVRDVAEEIAGTLPTLDVDANGAVPEWVRQYTSDHVLRVERDVRERLQERGLASGLTVSDEPTEGLNAQQAQAARALASAAPLVVVEGAAGSGKTTMLGVARDLASKDGRKLVVVAPTLRAAKEAAEATGARASSAHKLAHEYGFRWDGGRWQRLAVGDAEVHGGIYAGPSEAFQLDRNSRLVIDEGGMIDQELAHALTTITDETGAGLALIGDRQQLPAVGRGGVLDMAVAASPQPIDMSEVHRFRQEGYADLTRKLRQAAPGDDAGAAYLFMKMQDGGNIMVHSSLEAAHAHLVADTVAKATTGASVAVAVTSNEQADELNAQVQRAHERAGNTRTAGVAVEGRDGLTLRIGDRLMTRSNDKQLGVANRDVWTVRRVHRDGSVTVREKGATVRLPKGYVQEHTHLAYASTVYGVQGATVDFAHGVVDESTTAQSLYVAATRGRENNVLHIVDGDNMAPVEMFSAALAREGGDRGTAVATAAASRDVAGLDLTAAAQSDPALRAEREAFEQRRYQAQLRAWDVARKEWERKNPGGEPETWHERFEEAQQRTHGAEQRVRDVRREVEQTAEHEHGQAWEADWQQVEQTRAAKERASLLTRRKADQEAAAAAERFRQRHQAEPAPRPSTATVDKWRADATVTGASPLLDQARHDRDEAKVRERHLQNSKPSFGPKPPRPTAGTAVQEAAKDAAHKQRVQRRQEQQAAQPAAEQHTVKQRRGGPTLNR